MGNLAKDAKDLIIGNDGSDKEADDFKSELQKAINAGIISKSDGTLLITSRMNADKLGDEIIKRLEKELNSAKNGREFDTPEEAMEYEKEKSEKEEAERRKKKALEAARQAQEIQKKKNTTGGGNVKKNPQNEMKENAKKSEKEIVLEEKQ